MTFIVETFINPTDLINPDWMSIRFDNFDDYLKEAANALISKNTELFFILKSNLNTRILSLFDAYTTLAADSLRLSTNLTNIKAQLHTFKTNNPALKEELSHMYELREGSSELIHDYTQLYNINYTKNCGILLGIIFSCYVMSIMFKSKPITL